MAALYQIDRVKFKCNCDAWDSSMNMFFCRHCVGLRCELCLNHEIDSTYCPNCVEHGETRLRRTRCANCNECPVCETVLHAREVGDMCFLVCSSCRWSTKDSDIPEQAGSTNWPEHDNPYSEELNAVMDKLRSLASAEKAVREAKNIKRRSTTLTGSKMTDRFGLQQIYQKRKKTFERPPIVVPVHEPTEEVPEFDLSEIDVAADKPSLDMLMRQPLLGDRPLRPVHVAFVPKLSLRCKDCNHQVLKFDAGPCPVKQKIQLSTRVIVPTVRLSREPELVDGDISSVFLTVTNDSEAKVDVLIMPDIDDGLVECRTPLVELSLAPLDEVGDLFDGVQANVDPDSTNNNLVFRGRHRAGIRLEVKGEAGQNVLGLLLKFRNDLASESKVADQEPQWVLVRMRVHLVI